MLGDNWLGDLGTLRMWISLEEAALRIIFRAEIQTLMDTCILAHVLAMGRSKIQVCFFWSSCTAWRCESQWLMDFSFLEWINCGDTTLSLAGAPSVSFRHQVYFTDLAADVVRLNNNQALRAQRGESVSTCCGHSWQSWHFSWHNGGPGLWLQWNQEVLGLPWPGWERSWNCGNSDGIFPFFYTGREVARVSQHDSWLVCFQKFYFWDCRFSGCKGLDHSSITLQASNMEIGTTPSPSGFSRSRIYNVRFSKKPCVWFPEGQLFSMCPFQFFKASSLSWLFEAVSSLFQARAGVQLGDTWTLMHFFLPWSCLGVF